MLILRINFALFLIIFCFEVMSQKESEFKLIKPNLTKEPLYAKGKFVEFIDFNKSAIYKLNEGYLVVPIAEIYYPSYLFYKKEALDRCIAEKHFPEVDKIDDWYYNNKIVFHDWQNFIQKLDTNFGFQKAQEEDFVAKFTLLINDLQKRKELDKSLCELIGIIGQKLISKDETNYKWMLRKNYGGINPTFEPIVLDVKSNRYFEIVRNLLDEINSCKKGEVFEVRLFLKSIVRFTRKVDSHNSDSELIEIEN